MGFDHLLPEIIFNSVSVQGFQPTGRLFPLNSYENRVYEIGLEDELNPSIVAKYYRPGRWTGEAIGEEHLFIEALDAAEIPVVKPFSLKHRLLLSHSLAEIDGTTGKIYYTLYPKFRGREHAEITNDDRRWLGRSLARLHNVGEGFECNHRMTLTPETYGDASLEFILRQPFLPEDLRQSIETVLKTALNLLRPYFDQDWEILPLHGDCHPGNILWNKDGPHLLDFDDMVIAPPVQDVWMIFNGSNDEKREQQDIFFEGYEVFRKFDRDSLILSEPLRTLRMIKHAAWIGQRYDEPAFQKAFPYYEQRRYWEEFLQSIKEQISLLQEIS